MKEVSEEVVNEIAKQMGFSAVSKKMQKDLHRLWQDLSNLENNTKKTLARYAKYIDKEVLELSREFYKHMGDGMTNLTKLSNAMISTAEVEEGGK